MTRGDAVDIAEALRRLTDRLDNRSGAARRQARLSRAWTEMVGPMVSGHTGRLYLRSDELVVETDSPAWATELQALSETYRTELNKLLGQESVRSIRFTVSRRVKEDRAQDMPDAEGQDEAVRQRRRGRLSEAELNQIRESASSIPDERLREAVIRATIADLEWKKGDLETKSP